MAVFVVDFLAKRPGKLGSNPYEYNVDEYKHVDTKLIDYKETRNIPIKEYEPAGIDVKDDKIWIIGNKAIQVISMDGVQEFKKNIKEGCTCIEVTKEAMYIGFEDHITKYSKSGDQLAVWDVPGRNCVFTSIAAGDQFLFVADAGNRRILKYDFEGGLKGEFTGQARSSVGHGFIVPSANFDLLVNHAGELWIVNPGKHAIEEYDTDGNLLESWQNSSMKIDGFTGCCNPAEIAVLPDDSFVTSEKGLVRIKIYNKSGRMLSVVAAPEKFDEDGRAPEVTVDENGAIYALDFDRKVIRIFEKI